MLFLFSSYFFGKKLKNHLPADLISDFSENTTLDFELFYYEIINTITPEFSPILLFHIDYPVTPNWIMYITNEISYVWRMKIFSICWATVTKNPSFNILRKFGIQSFLLKLRNLCLNFIKDHEGFEFEWGPSSDWSWRQSVCRQWL